MKKKKPVTRCQFVPLWIRRFTHLRSQVCKYSKYLENGSEGPDPKFRTERFCCRLDNKRLPQCDVVPLQAYIYQPVSWFGSASSFDRFTTS
jgi:hypothetical protein